MLWDDEIEIVLIVYLDLVKPGLEPGPETPLDEHSFHGRLVASVF